MSNRRIILSGAYNVRDLGGYDVANRNTVRWRSLIRSDGTHALTPDDINTLLDYGLKSVIDLRTKEEADELPSVFFSLIPVRCQVVSMLPDGFFEMWKGGRSMADWYNFCLAQAKSGIRNVLEAVHRELTEGSYTAAWAKIGPESFRHWFSACLAYATRM
jgi:protein-tyrosine phosphatase